MVCMLIPAMLGVAGSFNCCFTLLLFVDVRKSCCLLIQDDCFSSNPAAAVDPGHTPSCRHCSVVTAPACPAVPSPPCLAATEHSLLASLWLLESWESVWRSPATVCLNDYLKHLALFSQEVRLAAAATAAALRRCAWLL